MTDNGRHDVEPSMQGDDQPFEKFQEHVANDSAAMHHAIDEDRKATKARVGHLKDRVKKLEHELQQLELQQKNFQSQVATDITNLQATLRSIREMIEERNQH